MVTSGYHWTLLYLKPWTNQWVFLMEMFSFSSAELLGRVWLFAPVHHHVSELAQTHVHRVGDASNHLILHHALLLLPSIFPSIRIFSNESALCIRWPKYWSFSFSIIPSKEHPRLIFFRMDWLDLLAVQGTLRSLLQHHSSKVLGAQPSSQSNSHIHIYNVIILASIIKYKFKNSK